MSGVGEGSAAGAGGNPGILQGIQESGSLNGSGGPGKAQEAASSNGDGGFSKAQEGGAVAEAPGLVRFLPRGSRRRAVAILERFWSLRQLLLVLTLLGTCGVLADGVLTPSISVLSAVGGLSTAHVALSNEAIVGISVGILVALFFIQQFGTSRISVVFSPVILIWLLGIAAVGVYNIATYMPGVFKVQRVLYVFKHASAGKLYSSQEYHSFSDFLMLYRINGPPPELLSLTPLHPTACRSPRSTLPCPGSPLRVLP